jgi:hypothetical protein
LLESFNRFEVGSLPPLLKQQRPDADDRHRQHDEQIDHAFFSLERVLLFVSELDSEPWASSRPPLVRDMPAG